MQNVDCIKAEQNDDLIEILLENIEKDTVIKLNFSGYNYQLIGDIVQLRGFWDIETTHE